MRPYEPETAAGSDDMSDRTQWLVVAVLLVSGILAPAFLYFVDPTTFGLSYRDTFLAVPMIPAILLGAIGVWTAVR
ncbi:hypothetical protein [Halobacterium litoreum]|uniref:Cox cluster protein n=1 Tax=Halobacterium litoreum TaxID=2039234 RepID=A0ABD5NDK5_9EURY|nr:hypothetical protein [Halobacterium litoreum]UHH13845.1 hypothetical protein LT972_02340 [Halobacterium litoreum]